ncbi:FAD-binding protein [Ornithinimicrobium flavum]|uniref:FAD-binding protein n=1 Tax=Ornithinimicrobium flavum TaxID=1288636 RepID=UPI001881CA70|nr:FAD-binding protein [Ornithinimicrobium flavum]
MGRNRDTPPVRRVVVLGASLAGLCAAAACAGDGRSVTVLERDVLPPRPGPRTGVPQGRQPHVLLHRGLLALEELLPGIGDDLRRAGAVELDTGDLAWLGEVGWTAYRTRQFPILSLTRPLFEHTVLGRVRALPGVDVRDGSRALSLRHGRAGAWQVVTAAGAVHDADLVVDATGRGSRLPTWLRELGLGSGEVSEVDARTGYATRTYAVPAGTVAPAGVVVQQTPASMAGGLALPVEEDRWLVTALGSGDHRPPRDAAGFEAFLRALPDPAVAEVVDVAHPLTDVAVHRQTGNRRHRYERLRRWPAGILPVGDAFVAFNPVYGQGIAVAACEGVVLRDALRAGWLPGRERHLLRQLARLTALPWAIASSEDLRLPSSEGSPGVLQDLMGRWSREVTRLAAHGDARAQRTMSSLYHLMVGPRVLLDPRLLVAALMSRITGAGSPNPRPQIVLGQPVAPGTSATPPTTSG